MQLNLLLGIVAWALSWLASFKLLLVAHSPKSVMHWSRWYFVCRVALPAEVQPVHKQSVQALAEHALGHLCQLAIWALAVLLVLNPALSAVFQHAWRPHVLIDLTLCSAHSQTSLMCMLH